MESTWNLHGIYIAQILIWDTCRREQAQQRAASAANFQQRRNKWAAQHRVQLKWLDKLDR